MRTVYKYTLDKHYKELQLPMGYKILSVIAQNDVIQLYCLIDTGNKEESVDFSVVGTGWDMKEAGCEGNVEHIGTVTTSSGVYVWHVFRHLKDTKQERIDYLTQEIKYSLPSKRILEQASVVAVIYNDTSLLLLKNRYEEELKNIYFENYDELHDADHDYSELHGKKIILSRKLLSERGLEAIYELERMED